jgi:hypothetical protein
MANQDIIQELKDLDSSLMQLQVANVFHVPVGYFDSFAEKALELVRLEWPAFLTRKPAYQVPPAYFEKLEERIMGHIRNHADYQSSQDELASLSPLLSGLEKRPVYSVPSGYFDRLPVRPIAAPARSRVVAMPARKLFRYAAAAVITAAIATAGLIVYQNGHKDPAVRTMAKFEKEVKSIDDVKTTESLIDLMDGGMNDKELASTPKVKTDDVQKLLQDVSTDELKDFSEQTKDIEDVMMTN